MHNQKKDNNEFKNKNQPELPENKLYGSPTTKELKKKHSSTLVGWVEMGSQHGKDTWQGSICRTVVGEAVAGRWDFPHLHVHKPGGTTGE